MKTTERALKELGLTLALFAILACLMYLFASRKEKHPEQASKKDIMQMQEMKDFHRSEGREIQAYQ